MAGDHVPKGDSLATANLLTRDYDQGIAQPIELHDDTLRDGEQTVGVAFTVAQKVEIAKMLLDAGVQSLSIGYPAVAEEERQAIRKILELGYDKRRLSCLSRAAREDVDAVRDVGIDYVGVFIPTSDIHLAHKLKLDEDTALERFTSIIKYAVDKGMRVRAGYEDATRTPMRRLRRFVEASIQAGASVIAIADTVGVLTPFSAYRIIKELVEIAGDVPIGAHFHNDLGMATANTIMAAHAGARLLMGSFGGLGERAGNMCLEEVATALRVKYGKDCGVDLRKLIDAGRRILEIARLPIAPCKPILGAHVFSHESGIHVHGITSDQATYEPFPPEMIGRHHDIQYGKHSGLTSVKHLARTIGVTASDEEMTQALGQIKARAISGTHTSPEDAAEILRAVIARRPPAG